MKKLFAMLAATVLMCGFASCGEKTSTPVEESSTQQATKSAEVSETEESVGETTTAAEATETTEDATTVTTAATTAKSAEQHDFQQVGGGIVFNQPVEEESSDLLIAAAQLMFEKACETEWNFSVGSPYELDLSQTAKNNYGWDCYLITTEGINSLDDIKADYHKIFSEAHNDKIDEVFIESDGRAYCLNGARGTDIFYEKSEITAVGDISESEIHFTVTNYYSGDDFGNAAYSEDEEFVISIDSDGAWRVAVFRLPY